MYMYTLTFEKFHLNLLWHVFLRWLITKSDLGCDIIRLYIWCLIMMLGKWFPKKSGRTKILQNSPMTVNGKYLYDCWWGMEWTISFLLLTILPSALSRWIFLLIPTRSFPWESSLHFETVAFYFLSVSRDLYQQRPIKWLCLILCIYIDQ